MAGPCKSAIISLLLAAAAFCPEAVHLLNDNARTLEPPVEEGQSGMEMMDDNMKGTPWEGLDEEATKAKIAEIWGNITGGKEPKSAMELPDKPSPKKFSNSEMVVAWDSTDAENSSNVSFFWDHACVGLMLTGNCTFKKNDKNNPPGLHVSLLEPLDDKARVVLSAAVKVLGSTKTFSTACNACNDTCNMKMDMAGKATMRLPVCPLSQTFDFVMPEMDFSRIPSFIRGYSVSSVELLRGTGKRAFKATLNTWV